MKNILIHTILFFFSATGLLFAQTNPTGYCFEGDEVVFIFDTRDYNKATKDNTSKKIDLDDLDIVNVHVSGEFNDWAKNKWCMTKTGSYTYEFRENIKNLDHSFSWEFKFIINEQYWAEPHKKFENITQAAKDGYWLDIYNLKMYTNFPTENANAHFFLQGHEDAKQVVLTGTFNKWDEHAFKMKKVNNGWSLPLNLDPGKYEYKFIVDGHWTHDAKNPHRRLNRFLTYNSIIYVKKQVNFILKGFENADKVALAGTFNDWDKNKNIMTKTDSGWVAELDLTGGKCHYKFVVDGEWITDPQNPVKEYDSNGFINSVKMVE